MPCEDTPCFEIFLCTRCYLLRGVETWTFNMVCPACGSKNHIVKSMCEPGILTFDAAVDFWYAEMEKNRDDLTRILEHRERRQCDG